MTNSTTDGLGFDRVNQNVTGTDTVSGTTIYATTLIKTKNFSATGSILVGGALNTSNVSTTGSVTASTFVLAGGRTLSAAGIGSPTGWGALMLAGSGVTSAGSLVWTSFGTAYGAVPAVLVQAKTVQAGLSVGSVSVGSFITYSVGAAINFDWISLG